MVVSWASAARAAGVTPKTLQAWVRRSGEKREDDDPWIHEIALLASECKELQAGRLEDKAWERAIVGWEEPVFYKGIIVGHKQKFDNGILMRLLEKRDPGYRPQTSAPAGLTVNMLLEDPMELFRRFKAHVRMQQVEAEAQTGGTLDLAIDTGARQLTVGGEPNA